MSGGRPKLCAVCGKEISQAHPPSCRHYEAEMMQRLKNNLLRGAAVIEPIGKRSEAPEIVN